MVLRWILAALHLLALGIGFGAVVARAGALRGDLARDLGRVFRADNAWAAAAALWIATGLLRAFAGFEKGTAYYVGNVWFWHKMALLGIVLALEVVPLVTLIRWRLAARRGLAIDLGRARLLARISIAQAVLVVAMVFLASGMARGFGAR
ncbi:MAG TPA: DUF2214 family protein [Longimicrobiales bacterium]|nr:DUF2214 family protein [Longimicrobiales bacterium]